MIAVDNVLSFEQRVRATAFGAVRILGLETEPKALRSLIRSRTRDSELNGFRVLLLDDSRTDAYVAQKYMRDEGLLVEHVQSPAKSLKPLSASGRMWLSPISTCRGSMVTRWRV